MYSTVRNEQGIIDGVLVVSEDLSDLKNAESDARTNESKYRHLFDLSPDAILVTRGDGTIVDASPSAASLFGKPLEQIIGMHQTDLHPPDQLPGARDAFQIHSDRDHPTPPVTIDILRPDGTRRTVDIRGLTFLQSGETFVLGWFRDITDRRRQQRQLEDFARERGISGNIRTGPVRFDRGSITRGGSRRDTL